jgi:hypothetical protein
MAITRNMLSVILKEEIHPHVVSTILYDHHVENRLDMLTDVEKTFREKYHYKLFIQCDTESHVVSYDVESAGVFVQYEY